MSKIEAVDLFCGVGGLTCGLEDAGIKVLAGFDIDPVCAYPYEANSSARFINKSVADLTGDDINPLFSPGVIRLLAGCAPCQPFSALANGAGARDEIKWGLLEQFARLVREVRPELVTMENVPRVTNHAPYQAFIATLESLGYSVDPRRVRCADYGIPQERRRFVLVASRLGDIRLQPPGENKVTVRDAIADLPVLAAGECDYHDPLHKARRLTPVNLQRIRASRPGGTWHDWPEELRSPCHRTERGASYQSVYARMEWDKPAPTITTQCFNFGTGRFGHPEQDRAITLREAAILQSFPRDYKFVPPESEVHFASVGRMIGNAVPPRLGSVVGRTLIDHLEQHHGG
jgi:DNA (cytosine-5)-methyltransferase 1